MTATMNAERSLNAKDLISISQLSADEIRLIFTTAQIIKDDPRSFHDAFADQAMVMLFEKPSLRTRVSFEVGFARLGGTVVFLDHQVDRIGERESISDYGRNLERWCDVIVARTYDHSTILTLSRSTSIPVINALSDLEHPCQALADGLTLLEHRGSLAGTRIAWVGDGNNVCHSLMLLAATLGFSMTVVTPEHARPDPSIIALAEQLAAAGGSTITLTDDPAAVAGHDAVYTDTWVSMGSKDDTAARRSTFDRYRVDAAMMSAAGPDALFMHCLPAHRGEEVTDEVIDSDRSIVFDQAENRMHVQTALLALLLADH